MSKWLVIIAMLLSPFAARACEIPGCTVTKQQEQKRHNPLKSKKFWIETAVVVGVSLWDAETTVSVLRRCSACAESNPLFSRRPSRSELYWKGGLTVVGERGLVALVWWRHDNAGSFLSTASAVWRGTFHTVAALSNHSEPGDIK